LASLYEIDRSILECIDQETGEMIDPERLENLFMERNQKIENIALWIKNLQSDALAYKAEKEAFAEREKIAINKADRLKKYLADALEGQKFTTSRCAVSFRRSETISIADESILPKEFLKETITYKPDKTAIKNAIKSGKEVNGCCLVENLNTQIK
jgi:hypothetical protein